MGARQTKWLLVLLLISIGLSATSLAADDEPPRLLEIIPARTDEMVVCRLISHGLPGQRLLQSMQSGLVSAIDLHISLRDEHSRVLHEHGLSLRLAFDVWEEVFSVSGQQRQRSFSDGNLLQLFLNDMPDVPLLPLSLVPAGRRCRIHIGLKLHAIAPSERGRVEQLIAGDSETAQIGQDQQEVSISLGRLIRFFYKGSAQRSQLTSEVLSPWFMREELADATD